MDKYQGYRLFSYAAKGPIYRIPVSVITSSISSFRLSLTLNSVWYHKNWSSKSTWIAMVNSNTKVYRTREIVLNRKIEELQCTTMVILYCTKKIVVKAFSLGLWLFQNAMLSSLWLDHCMGKMVIFKSCFTISPWLFDFKEPGSSML